MVSFLPLRTRLPFDTGSRSLGSVITADTQRPLRVLSPADICIASERNNDLCDFNHKHEIMELDRTLSPSPISRVLSLPRGVIA